jgi:hypothetical protein
MSEPAGSFDEPPTKTDLPTLAQARSFRVQKTARPGGKSPEIHRRKTYPFIKYDRSATSRIRLTTTINNHALFASASPHPGKKTPGQ